MKKIIKAFIVAFSMYSKIPMPRFNWASEDMKYHLCFFPWVGVVIGALEYLWANIAVKNLVYIPDVLYICVALALPLLLTGGFHMDGFLDTMDALHSYGDKEKKLSILKDPHVGAFAIISLLVYILLSVGFLFVVYNAFTIKPFITVCFAFVISRCLSGISVTYFPKAKKNGMVAVSSEYSSKKTVGIILILELIITIAFLIWLNIKNLIYPLVCISCMGLSFLYYYMVSKKQFGGINGDLAGFFVCISELAALIGIGVVCMMGL